MYTIRNKRKIVGSASNIEDATKKFLEEQVKQSGGPMLTGTQFQEAVYAINVTIEHLGRFQWNNITVTKG